MEGQKHPRPESALSPQLLPPLSPPPNGALLSASQREAASKDTRNNLNRLFWFKILIIIFCLRSARFPTWGMQIPTRHQVLIPRGVKPLTQTSHRRTTLFFLLFSLHLLFIFTQYTQLTQNSSFKALIYFTEDNELTITLTFPAPPPLHRRFLPSAPPLRTVPQQGAGGTPPRPPSCPRHLPLRPLLAARSAHADRRAPP